jgi:hypothetical protein
LSDDTAEIEATSSKPKSNGKARFLTLSDLDMRTRAAREARDRFSAIVSDLGGDAAVSAGERALVEQAAVLAAMRVDQGTRWLQGEGLDVTTFATIANAERRALEAVGLKRRPRDTTPDLSAYLAARSDESGGAPHG